MQRDPTSILDDGLAAFAFVDDRVWNALDLLDQDLNLLRRQRPAVVHGESRHERFLPAPGDNPLQLRFGAGTVRHMPQLFDVLFQTVDLALPVTRFRDNLRLVFVFVCHLGLW